MSSIPNNGLVTVSFQVDRSAVDSYLAELRKGVTVPVKADYNGPAGPAGGSSAASIAGSNGPATFGNLAGAPVYGTGPSGVFMGGPSQGNLGGAMYVGGMGYGGGGGAGAGQNVLGPAASALQTAALELKAAAIEMKAANATFASRAAVSHRIPSPNETGAPFLNAGDVVDEGPAPSLVGPAGPSGTTSNRPQRGSYSVRSAMMRSLSSAGGLMAMGGVWAAFEAGSSVLGEHLQNEQAQRMAALGGATPSEMASARLQHLENIRNGGFMGANKYIQPVASWLASQGVNPGGLFTRLPNAEATESALAQAEHEGQFYNQTINQGIDYRKEIAQSGQVNQQTRQRMAIHDATSREILGISARFSSEENRYRAAAGLSGKEGADARGMLKSLDKQEDEQISLAYQAGQAKLEGFDRDVAIQYRAATQGALTSSAVARHLMQGSGDLALRASIAGQLREFDTTAASKFADTPEGNAARAAARGSIIEQGNLDDFARTRRGKMMQLGLTAENSELEVQLHASSPQVGGMLRRIAGIASNAGMSAYQTSIDPNIHDEDKIPIEKDQLYRGKLQLEEFRQSWFRSNQPRQISSINQQALSGEGTAKSSDVNTAIDKMSAKLDFLNAHVGKIESEIADFVNAWD